MAGYDVYTAQDGEEAVAAFNKYNPDLVVLDVMMPKMDGYGVTREIRRTSDVPIIILRSDLESDVITQKAIDFCENLEAKTILFDLKDYADVDKLLSPFIMVIPLEWFVYYLAHFNGEDPGATRHIGKVRY
jgi:CheY-like chemotaxis protein